MRALDSGRESASVCEREHSKCTRIEASERVGRGSGTADRWKVFQPQAQHSSGVHRYSPREERTQNGVRENTTVRERETHKRCQKKKRKKSALARARRRERKVSQIKRTKKEAKEKQVKHRRKLHL